MQPEWDGALCTALNCVWDASGFHLSPGNMRKPRVPKTYRLTDQQQRNKKVEEIGRHKEEKEKMMTRGWVSKRDG